MEEYSDNYSDICLSELNSRNRITGINDEPNLDHETVRIEQCFNMKNQIGELTSLVRKRFSLVLTKRMTETPNVLRRLVILTHS